MNFKKIRSKEKGFFRRQILKTSRFLKKLVFDAVDHDLIFQGSYGNGSTKNGAYFTNRFWKRRRAKWLADKSRKVNRR